METSTFVGWSPEAASTRTSRSYLVSVRWEPRVSGVRVVLFERCRHVLAVGVAGLRRVHRQRRLGSPVGFETGGAAIVGNAGHFRDVLRHARILARAAAACSASVGGSGTGSTGGADE